MLNVSFCAGVDHRKGEQETVNTYKEGECAALHTVSAPAGADVKSVASSCSCKGVCLNWDVLGSENLLPEGHQLGAAELLFAKIEDPADIDDVLDKKNEYDWDYVDESVLALRARQPQVTVYVSDDEQGRGKAENLRHAADSLKSAASAGLYGDNADFGPLSVEMSVCDDSGWKDKWKEYFKPAKVGKTIVVKPTWEEYEAKPGEKVLEIDPGMAFGTGTHETTSLCIKMMEDYMKPGDKVLDVGCGSGTISIFRWAAAAAERRACL